MRRLDSLRQRFAFVAVVWAVLVMPALVLSQSGGQTQPPPPSPARPEGFQRVILNGDLSRTFPIRPIGAMVVPEPPFNKGTDAKIALGRQLFFDKSLSIDRTTACATCHDPGRAFTDGRPLAVGVGGKVGRRNSPTLVNRGFGRVHFWDGRESSLEELVLQPIADPAEMGLPLPELRARLDADAAYREAFQAAFAGQVSVDTAGAALAAYLRTIRSGDSSYDRFSGGATDAMSDDAKAGLTIFRGKGRCSFCHREPLFTDEMLWNTGVALRPDNTLADNGGPAMFGAATPGRPQAVGAFKTPTLREVARTAPYMHDGSMATLADVVEFYDKGGRANAKGLFIRPLNLSVEEKRALVAFLESLSGVVTGK
jgi:cytochrome c peroxidase